MRKTYKFLSAFVAGMLIVTSCNNDDLLELNVNKNAATDMDMRYLLSLGTLRIGGEYENTRALMLYASTMIQHTASTASYFSGDKYYYSAQYSGAYMERHYTDVIRLFAHVINKTEGVEGEENVNAVATILKVFDLSRMTDLYGDVPYSEAGRGLEGAQYFYPKYDNQEDIYNMMFDELKAARDKLSASSRALGNQDFIYGGEVTKWKKLANALLMRYAMRISQVDAAKAQAIFTEANTNGAFIDNGDNAYIKYASGPQGVNRNGLNDGYWNTYKYSRDCKISKTFIDWMVANNDPRLMIVSGGTGNPDDSGTWDTNSANQIGMPNGYTEATILNPGVLSPTDLTNYNANGRRIFSMLNLKYLDWADPYALITYAEVELMRAEAALNGWIGTDANTHFTNGVTAAINSWTNFDASFAVDPGTISSYVTGRGFAAASTADKRRLIGEEYWAATYLNDIESWSNWRRTGFPALTPTNDPGAHEGPNPQIPRRLIYWEAENANNPANIASAKSRMGGDTFATRMWWDGGN